MEISSKKKKKQDFKIIAGASDHTRSDWNKNKKIRDIPVLILECVVCGHIAMTRHYTQTAFTHKHSKHRQKISQTSWKSKE